LVAAVLDRERDGGAAVRDLVLLIVIVAAVYGLGLGGASLWDIDEAIYADISRNMAESGDWVFPVFNGGPRFDKPPLLLWIGAAAMKVLGPVELAARVGTYAFALAGMALVYAFGRRLHSHGAGVLAALVLPATLGWFVAGRMGLMDAGLSFFIGLAVYQLARLAPAAVGGAAGYGAGPAGTGGAAPAAAYAWLGVALALGVLTKGPVAVILVGGTALLYFGPRKLWQLVWRRESLIALGLFLAVALPWHAAIYARAGEAWWNDYFGYHMFARFTQPLEEHGYPWYFYLVVLTVGFLPWTGFAAGGLRGPGTGRSHAQRRAHWLLVAWFLVVLVFFSASRTKLPGYILPAFLPLAVMTGVWCEERLQRPGAARAFLVTLWLSVGAGAVFAAALAALRPMVPAGYEDVHRLLYALPAALVAGMLLTRAAFAWRGDARVLVYGFGATALVGMVVFTMLLAPRLEQYKPVKALVAAAGTELAAGAQLVSAYGDASSAFYASRYSPRPVLFVHSAQEVRGLLADPSVLAIVPEAMLAELPEAAVVAGEGPGVLVRGTQAGQDKAPAPPGEL